MGNLYPWIVWMLKMTVILMKRMPLMGSSGEMVEKMIQSLDIFEIILALRRVLAIENNAVATKWFLTVAPTLLPYPISFNAPWLLTPPLSWGRLII